MAQRFLSLLRIVAALLFLAHGAHQLFGFPGATPPVPLVSLAGLGGVIELVGGALLVLGLFTRPAACVAAVEAAVTFAIVQFRQGSWPVLNHAEIALLYTLLFLYIAFAGPGPWSLDARAGAPPDDIRTTGARRLK